MANFQMPPANQMEDPEIDEIMFQAHPHLVDDYHSDDDETVQGELVVMEDVENVPPDWEPPVLQPWREYQLMFTISNLLRNGQHSRDDVCTVILHTLLMDPDIIPARDWAFNHFLMAFDNMGRHIHSIGVHDHPFFHVDGYPSPHAMHMANPPDWQEAQDPEELDESESDDLPDPFAPPEPLLQDNPFGPPQVLAPASPEGSGYDTDA